MEKLKRAVLYARFSSDMQRDESIDAQERAIKKYAEENGYALVASYIDKAKSATTDQRPQFQRMISAAAKGTFEAVLVHKLDRFARNRYDSATYRYQLKKNGVKLISVTEALDGSPESIILESMLEGLSEYYSRNLAREVEKGKRENALKGLHVGGLPPLGYDVDYNTMLLVINPREAEAVRLIFNMYVSDYGYTEILNALKQKGYKTKVGKPFGKGSLHGILRNEKYTGVYVYNRSVAKDEAHPYNRHALKPDEEIIKVKDKVPVIITKEIFDKAQAKLKSRKQKSGKFSAKEVYLLSGKIKCGECGSSYVGFVRKARSDHPKRTAYRCSKGHGVIKCDNGEIERNYIEGLVLDKLSEFVFSPTTFAKVADGYKKYVDSVDTEAAEGIASANAYIHELDRQINNIVEVIANTGSAALSNKLLSLEREREQALYNLEQLQDAKRSSEISITHLKAAFDQCKVLFRQGKFANIKKIVDEYVEEVLIYKDRIEIYYKFGLPDNPTKIKIPKELNETEKSGRALLILDDIYNIMRVTVSRKDG